MFLIDSASPEPVTLDTTSASLALPGFSPDPSIVRVGSDYYLITSTFQFFPAIAIHHSRDLVRWSMIGHVFSRPEELDLSDFFDGCGIWAPDISHHAGEFYIFFCLVQLTQDRRVNVRGNYMVKSRHILGPYSRPVQLTTEGNDPSHFVDTDGSHHLLYAAGIPRGKGVKIVRLSDDCTRVVGEPRWLEFEPEKRAPEGPHLVHKDDHYYLTLAAGDGIYRGHHQLIARSRHLHGPYEPSPLGPFIVERSPEAEFYHHGHAKLVTTPEGLWRAAYLLRRRTGGFSPLGRETAIEAVHWRADGWPVLNAGDGPADRPPPPPAALRDDFDTAALDPSWMFIRRPLPGGHDLAVRPGFLRLAGGVSAPDALVGVNAVLRRETNHAFVATTRLEFVPTPASEAGLLAYYDTSSHVRFVVAGDLGAILRLSIQDRGCHRILAETPLLDTDTIFLRMTVRGLVREFAFSYDGMRWLSAGTAPDCSCMSDEGTANWGFTGTLVGLYARRSPEGSALRADFDWLAIDPA
ncbi:MAG: family 43 glycosylhydrolase [Opitutaceae bacterium]|jgi:xylan 1,4-beta-xylosidase|nr:family 43 glycosylhydrolase [Opitutaceae bacterium]